MPVVAHPGPAAPVAPAVRLEVPEGWAAVPAGDALLRTSGPGTRGDAVAVVVRQVVDAEDVSTPSVVDDSTTRALPGAGEVEEPFVVEVGGREWHARHVSWDDAGAPVVEVHLATTLAATGPASRHLLVVGRVVGDGIDEDYDVLQGVLETITVDEGGTSDAGDEEGS